jgi:hypothetical protein
MTLAGNFDSYCDLVCINLSSKNVFICRTN